MEPSTFLRPSAVDAVHEEDAKDGKIEPLIADTQMPEILPGRKSWPVFLQDARIWEDGDWHC